jgi:hypothetical protein
MDLDKYQDEALKFVTHPHLYYFALGLSGEVAEFIDAVDQQSRKDVVKEAGDVLWYVANLATELMLPLSEIMGQTNFYFPTILVGTLSVSSLLSDMLNLVKDSGKVSEVVKKIYRDQLGDPTDEQLDMISMGLFRIVSHLHWLVHANGSSLDIVAHYNLVKLADRKERGVLSGSGDDR